MTNTERMAEIKGEHTDMIDKPLPDDCDVCYLFARVEKLERLLREAEASVHLDHDPECGTQCETETDDV